jgi:hypothetical protein
MAKLYDELVSFRRGSDTGDNDANSVQPLSNTEAVWADNDNRPIDNLRVRTETLRQGLETANYFADYDRALLLRADAALTFSEPTAGAYELTLASAGSLWVYPALSPGRQSGGRWQGGRVFCANPSAAGAWTAYSGTPAVDDLILTTHRQYTGQRGYADADNFTTTPGGRTTGANRTVVTLIADPAVAGGVPGITAVIEGEPRVRIRITYGTAGTPTTLADLISYINNDRTSQGAYGVADFLRASSTGVTTNAPIPFTNGVVQGAYDAEAHEITKAQFDAFFAAVTGLIMWWKRRPSGAMLSAPLPPSSERFPRSLIVLIGLFCVMVPIAGLSLLAVLVVDALVGKTKNIFDGKNNGGEHRCGKI